MKFSVYFCFSFLSFVKVYDVGLILIIVFVEVATVFKST